MTESVKLTRRAGLIALAGSVFAFAADRVFAQSSPPPGPPPTVPPAVVHERERILNEAERRMREARDLLFRAGHEYGGHRVRAIQFIDGALGETGQARRFLI